jgi:hypothetical protein
MIEPYYEADRVVLHLGDSVEVMRSMADESVDAIVTDPPYELTSGKRGGTGAASINLDSPYGRARIGTGNGAGGFMGKAWDATGIAHSVEMWSEALRVLKPGGHLAAFGGTRTYHRMAVAIEDAGFEVRDCLAWMYGSGFPKSLDVSKAIESTILNGGSNTRRLRQTEQEGGGEPYTLHGRNNGIMGEERTYERRSFEPTTEEAQQWEGWGTALKPAYEPIVLARKPLNGTVAANVLRYGTGAINVDGCRIGTTKDVPASAAHDRENIAKGAERGRTADTSGFERGCGGTPRCHRRREREPHWKAARLGQRRRLGHDSDRRRIRRSRWPLALLLHG